SGMMCQGMRKEIQTKGVVSDSIHLDALGDMQKFIKMLVAFNAAIFISEEEVIELDDSLRWAEVSQSLWWAT
nr:hypothetical protein [Tanacetum cinerariifolium]